MSSDQDRQALERELSGLQGRHETLRDLIADLQRKPELTSGEQGQLAGLENELAGLERRMDDIGNHL